MQIVRVWNCEIDSCFYVDRKMSSIFDLMSVKMCTYWPVLDVCRDEQAVRVYPKLRDHVVRRSVPSFV